jgi:DNA-directed RNA polymerase alpha subunit
MTREDRLDALAMEAMKAAIVNGGIVNAYALAMNSYKVAEEMIKMRQLVLERILLGEKPSMLLDEIPFTVRTSNCLRLANIYNVGQLQQWTENELLRLPNFGRKSLKEVIDEMQNLGLQLRDPQMLR